MALMAALLQNCNEKSGFEKAVDVIKNLRSEFGNDFFRQEAYKQAVKDLEEIPEGSGNHAAAQKVLKDLRKEVLEIRRNNVRNMMNQMKFQKKLNEERQ
jgi:hypothetical protein